MVNMMQNDGLSIASRSDGLEKYVADSNQCMRFRLIRSANELKSILRGESSGVDEDEESSIKSIHSAFKPEMTHQIYGEHENIFGYVGLKVDLWLTADTLKGFLRVNFREKLSPEQCEGVEPDPVVEPLLKILASDQVTENLNEFESQLYKSDSAKPFQPFGSKLSEFESCSKLSSGDSETKTFEIYQCTVSDQGFRDFHERLQFWLLFFIDAASFIDADDDRWTFFTLFEKYKTSEGKLRYAIAGYATVYCYFAYPENLRPRISQMLILPPFQKRGLGATLLDTVCKSFWNRNKVVDITVEDPSDDFIRLRDFVDVQNALKNLDCFSCFEKVRNGFNNQMISEAKDKLKLGKKQTRRVYEIIRLYWIKKVGPLADENPEYKAYRVDVKKRLNLPYQKEKNQMEKLKKALKPEEFAAATLTMTNREQRLENLQAQFNELLDHYMQILNRISAS